MRLVFCLAGCVGKRLELLVFKLKEMLSFSVTLHPSGVGPGGWLGSPSLTCCSFIQLSAVRPDRKV